MGTTPFLIVDVLDLASIIAILRRFPSLRSVRYIVMTTGMLGRVTATMLSWLGWSIKPLQYSLAPEDHLSPYKEFELLLLDRMRECRQRIFSRAMNVIKDLSEYERVRIMACLGKYAGADLYFAMQLYVTPIVRAEGQDKIEGILFRSSPFSEIIAETYQHRHFKVYFYRSYSCGKFTPRPDYHGDRLVKMMMSRGAHSFVQCLLLLGYSLLCKLISSFMPTSTGSEEHKICALVANPVPTELRSCLPWVCAEESDLTKEVFALRNGGMNAPAIEFYRTRCDCFAQYNFNPLVHRIETDMVLAWARYGSVFLMNLWRYHGLLLGKGVGIWGLNYVLDMVVRTSFFEAVFKTQGTRVLWTMNEDDSETQMAAMAIHRVGGVSAGTTWSQAVLPQWGIQRNQNDILFAWGQRMVDVRMGTHDQCDSFVITGYPGDYHFQDALEEARFLRDSICERGSDRKVLVFFDTVPLNDGLISVGLMLHLYEELFAWLEDDSKNFLVIKTKRAESLDKIPGAKKQIEKLCKNDRVLILDRLGAVYPGLAADVVIGMGASLGLPSLSATLGQNVVLYDPQRVLLDYPLSLPNVTVISNGSEIRPAINRALKTNRQPSYQNKLQPISGSSIDPFADGNAALRCRTYIRNLLQAFGQGSTNYDAVSFSNEQHTKRWGKATVIRGPLRISPVCAGRGK